MTTPQEMSADEQPLSPTNQIINEGNEAVQETGFILRLMSKTIGWLIALGLLTLLIATIVFIALALWQGIIWLWPGGVS